MNFKTPIYKKKILGHFEIDLSEIVLMVISLAALCYPPNKLSEFKLNFLTRSKVIYL